MVIVNLTFQLSSLNWSYLFIYLFIHLFTENGKKNAGFRDNWADYQSEGFYRGGLTMRTLKAKLATRLKTFRGKAKTLKKKAQAGPRIWELSDQEVQKSSNQASERSNGFFYMPMDKQTVHKGQKKVTRTSQNEKQGWRTFGIVFFGFFSV